jgi:aryl-alcohol dehydrogenase-like predicted oxidoreductase
LKIILGTANFGLNYGLANTREKLKENEIRRIIQAATKLGINQFDTAIGYGDSQKILGKFLDKSLSTLITTKIGRSDCGSVESMITAIQNSCNDLNVRKIDSVLLHEFDLINSSIVKDGLLEILKRDLASNVGISVYNQNELYQSSENNSLLKVAQIPINLLSRNTFSNKFLQELSKSGFEITVRSVFLQGILTSNISLIPDKLKHIIPKLYEFENICKKFKVSKLSALLAYVKQLEWCSGIVIGVENAFQLEEFVAEYHSDRVLDFNIFPELDSWTSDPRNWS